MADKPEKTLEEKLSKKREGSKMRIQKMRSKNAGSEKEKILRKKDAARKKEERVKAKSEDADEIRKIETKKERDRKRK